MPAAELPACVFCGQPIGPGEATAGRAPMAAHAACADAALADDAHWEEISAGSAEGGDVATEEGPKPPGGRAGCLAVGLLPVLAMLARLLVLS